MMSTRFRLISSSLTLGVVAAVAVAAQQPRITNGRVTTQAAGMPFAQSFRALVGAQSDVTWIGYGVAVVDGQRTMCCADAGGSTFITGSVVMVDGRNCCSACRLEPSAARSAAQGPSAQVPSGSVKLEGSDEMTVLFRVAERRIERIRIFSHDCEIDAGGRSIIWLENVRGADSIALLESLAVPGEDRGNRVADGAISAIAMHRDAAADASLERLVAANQPESIRRKVTFWLGNTRGARGLSVLRRVLSDDPSAEVKKSAVFGVSQSREPGAFDMLAGLAVNDASPRIRSEAIFWIAQQGDARAQKVILNALEKDAEADVRKKAVFALRQLKDNAGVDALIQTARTSTDPTVRSEAIFWLGQKAGAKASSAITERIEQDPDTEVKKRAVFALSQFPKNEGIPLLIKVARTNTNPAVRKQAMFWLAQSRDPRAVEFFAEILK